MEPWDPRQMEALRRMTHEEKWQIVMSLLQTATDTRLAALRRNHPEWSEAQVEAELAAERIRGSA